MTDTITIGGREFTLPEPTIPYLLDLAAVIDNEKVSLGGNIERNAALVQVALKAGGNVFDVRTARTSASELNAATRAVMLGAGFEWGKPAGESGAAGRRLSDQLNDLVGALATGCGYVWPRDFERLTLAGAERIFRYWERSPPTYQLVAVIAGILGWKPPETEADRERNAEEFRRLSQQPLPPLELGGMPAPVLDLDAFRAKKRAEVAATPGSAA